jgi:hypothetical protein
MLPLPETGARFSPDVSADEISKAEELSLASNAAPGVKFLHTPMLQLVGPADIAITEKHCMLQV